MERRKYEVYIYHMVREDTWSEYVLRTDSPKDAIERWIVESCNNPMMVAIDTTRTQYALDLIEWARENKEWIKERCEAMNNPYKWEYLEKGIDGRCTFHEDMYNGKYEPDQIYPFCLG